MRPHRHEGKRKRVIPAQDRELLAQLAPQAANSVAVTASFFDADNRGACVRELHHGFYGDLDATPRWNVVENDGKTRCGCNRPEVRGKTLLGWLVVIGNHLQ